MKEIYLMTPEIACQAMNSRMEGLNDEEVQINTKKYGPNIIVKKKNKSIIKKFLANFTSLMAILLWIGGAVAFWGKIPELGFAIWLVNIINGLFSFWQEFRAEKATEALKKIIPSHAKVIRNGKEVLILSEELVPGDIMSIEEGDMITADARVLRATEFQVNQSTLTGESNPARKIADAYEEENPSWLEIRNLIFAGTSAASGSATAVVISTGMNTQFGKIANLTLTMADELSPLQKELNKLTKQISLVTILIGIIFFTCATTFVKMPVAAAFIYSLGMIVAFIPEGLLPTVTLSLAMAVQRMAKNNALVKKLSAVETLGCTNVICTDKTGTLTQNEMTVSNIWLPDQQFEVTGLGYSPEGKIMRYGVEVIASSIFELRHTLTAAALCNNSRLIAPSTKNDRYTVLGDPTEACLIVAAKKAGISLEQKSNAQPRLKELPFDSRRKMMSTIHQPDRYHKDFHKIAYVKGAPKEVLALCTQYFYEGRRENINDAIIKKIVSANDDYARKGLRVLAIACRFISDSDNLPENIEDYTEKDVEQNLIFLGLIAMADPARPEVAQAVSLCREAGIRVIMITGDYGLTAESIGKKIGIIKSENPIVITGSDLENMTDEKLKKDLEGEVIFARVAPEQKYRIVCALQETGNIVAVTGDGVNDSPALKKADIGVAMGIAGTDVAKEAADMILTDDNFASIVKAIEEGRAVYSNIRKFLLYILNSNMPEAIPTVAFLFSLGAIPLPLTMMQILSIDLGTDMMPALGLGAELPEKGVMSMPPRSQNAKLLNKRVFVIGFLWYGMIESVVCMIAYFMVNVFNGWPAVALASSGDVYLKATTMTLASIVFCQIAMVMNCRTERESVFKSGLFSNKKVLLGILVELVLIVSIIYVPFLQDIFGTYPIDLKDWAILFAIPVPIFLIEEGRKYFVRKYRPQKYSSI